MAQYAIDEINVDAGGVYQYDPTFCPDIIYLQTTTLLLTNDFTLQFTTALNEGQSVKVFIPYFDDDGYNVVIFGRLHDNQPASLGWVYEFYQDGSGNEFCEKTPLDFTDTSLISGLTVIDATLTLAKLENLTSAQIIVGNGSNRPAAVAVTGDVTISNAGVTAIGSDKITNAMVKSNAAIARTKLANGTASQVVINDGSGVMSSEAQLANTRGGTGQDTSASTGFAKVSAGTWSVSALTDVAMLKVSWETGYVGDFKILMPFAGTVTGIYGFLDKAVGAADALVTPKNNAGTTMTSGVLTFTASDPKGTAETSTPSANNTFIAGDVLTFTTSGGSAAGVAQLSITYTRTS